MTVLQYSCNTLIQYGRNTVRLKYSLYGNSAVSHPEGGHTISVTADKVGFSDWNRMEYGEESSRAQPDYM